MSALGRTVRIRFLDGQERTFPHVRVDRDKAGWLFLTRLQTSPILSGVPAPVAGYRLQTLNGWEYVETDAPARMAPVRRAARSSARGASH